MNYRWKQTELLQDVRLSTGGAEELFLTQIETFKVVKLVDATSSTVNFSKISEEYMIWQGKRSGELKRLL